MSIYTIFLRVITILLILCTYVYWLIQGYRTEKAKPKNKKSFSFPYFINRHIIKVTTGIVLLQLCGLRILPMQNNFLLQSIGFLLVAVGTIISILARKELGTNWTHAADYQVKKEHSLVITGIYQYIRHPIYFGSNIMLIGAELLAGSYLFLFYCFNFIYDYYAGKREEKILVQHFGDTYKKYQQKTKMLIPFIF